MADGSVNIDTKLDSSGLENGLSELGGIAKKGAIAIAAAIGGIGAAVTKLGADFESTMSGIEAVTGATEEQMSKLSKAAMEAGKDTVYSASEAAEAMEELLKAGLSVDQVLDGGLTGALNLASAGGIGLADAADIAATALNSFKDDALSMTKAADILAGAANASATDVMGLKMGLSQASAVASGMGLTFEDTATSLALFAQNGLKGSDAGTSLKTMLMNLQPQTDKQIGLFEELGLRTDTMASAFYDAQGHMKPMNEIAGLLQDSMKDLTDQERALALETMFGSDAVRAGNILFKEGKKGIDAMNAAIKNVTAAEVAKKRLDNLKGSLENLKGSLETVAIGIYNDLQEPMRDAVETISSSLKKNMPDIQKNLTEVFKATMEFGKWMFANGPEIASAITGIGTAMVAFKVAEVVKAAEMSWIAYKKATEGATIAQWAMNTATNANPLGALISVIVGVTAALTAYGLLQEDHVSKSEKLLDSVNKRVKAWNDLKKAQSEQATSSLSEIDNTKRLSDELKGLVDANGKVIGSKERVKFLTEEINKVLPDSIKYHEEEGQAYADISKELDNLIQKKQAQILLDSLEPQYKEALKNASKEQLKSIELENQVIADQNALKKNQLEYDEAYAEWMSKGGREAGAHKLFQLELEQQKLQEHLSSSQAAYDKNKAHVKDYYDTISLYEDTATKAATGHYNEIDRVNILVGQSFKNAKDNTLAQLQAQVTDTITNYNNLVGAVGNGNRNINQRQIDDARLLAETAYREYRAAGGNIILGLEDGMTSKNSEIDMTGSTARYARKMKQMFTDEMGIHSPSTVFAGYGGNIVTGLWNGMNNNTDWLLGKVGGFAQSVIKVAKSVLGIHSPSRVFRDVVGANLMLGLAEGIEDESGTVLAAMADIAKEIANTPFDINANELADKFNNIDIDDAYRKVVTTFESNSNSIATEKAINSNVAKNVSSKDSGSSSNSQSEPKYILNKIYTDGRETAKVLTPYVAKQLDWEGK